MEFDNGTILAAVVSAAVAALAALQARDEVRLVTILALFCGGLGAGAGLASAIAGSRRTRRARGEA